MKKTYSRPTAEVIKIQTQQMLAVSNRGLSDTAASVSGEDYSNALAPDFEFFE